MNNPDTVPIDPKAEAEWLKRYRQESGKSWSVIEKESGIPRGTISQLANGTYGGDIEAQGRRLFKFRQKIESQEQRSRTALAAPTLIETPTARRLQFLLEVAHLGRIVVAATGPGNSKTMVAEHYQASMANCWMTTIRESNGSLPGMIGAAMEAMRLTTKSGWTRQRSNQVIDFLRDRGGLLIVDEAGHLTLDALEELRGWHDSTGVGIALFGNEELLLRIRSGEKRHQYARLNSRIAMAHIQDVPRTEDVDLFLDAFDIDDAKVRKLLTAVALSPHNGGLREVKQIIESAHMIAIADDTAIELGHIEESMASRLTQHMRRAA